MTREEFIDAYCRDSDVTWEASVHTSTSIEQDCRATNTTSARNATKIASEARTRCLMASTRGT